MEEKMKVELTEEEALFLKNFVVSMSGDSTFESGHSGNNTSEDFKKDFILTEEHEDMIEKLHENLHESIVYELYDMREKQGRDHLKIETLYIWYNLILDSITQEGDNFFADLAYDFEMILEEEEEDY